MLESTTRISVQIPDSVFVQLKNISLLEDRSVSNVVRRMIIAQLEQEGEVDDEN